MSEQTPAHAPVLCSHHSHHNRMWNVFPNVSHQFNRQTVRASLSLSFCSSNTQTPEASNNRNTTMPWINNNNHNNNEYESKRFTCEIIWLCIETEIDCVEQRWLQICLEFIFIFRAKKNKRNDDAFHLLLKLYGFYKKSSVLESRNIIHIVRNSAQKRKIKQINKQIVGVRVCVSMGAWWIYRKSEISASTDKIALSIFMMALFCGVLLSVFGIKLW